MTPEDKQRIYDAGYKQGQEDTHAEIRSHFYEKGDTACEPCLTIAAVKGVQVRFTFTGEVNDECAERGLCTKSRVFRRLLVQRPYFWFKCWRYPQLVHRMD